MRTLISGASGLVGSALQADLERDGHEVIRLVRPPSEASPTAVRWDSDRGLPDGTTGLENLDAVVHLAGANVAAGRWTPARKALLRDSRVRGTRLLCEALATLNQKPRVLISASATGYYGASADSGVDESSPPGEGFLAGLCVDWEQAADPAREAGIRTVHPRIGLVLAAGGGALAKMEKPFRLGLGGTIGSGRQVMSWISLADLVHGLRFLIDSEGITGPVNMVSPHPVSNRDFTGALARALHRPAVLPLPAFAARMLFGEMADETLLASQRVHPGVLTEAGFRFKHPDLKSALDWACA